jgi:hypothetical protein
MTQSYKQLSEAYYNIHMYKGVHYLDIARHDNSSIYIIRLLNGNSIRLRYEGMSYNSALYKFINDATVLLKSIFEI